MKPIILETWTVPRGLPHRLRVTPSGQLVVEFEGSARRFGVATWIRCQDWDAHTPLFKPKPRRARP